MHVGVQVISPGTDRVTLTTRWSLMQYSYWFSNVKCQLAIYQGEPRHILCFFALSLPTVNCNTTHTPFPEFYLWYFSEKMQALSQTQGSPTVTWPIYIPLCQPIVPRNASQLYGEEREMPWVLLCSFPVLETWLAEILSTEQSAQVFPVALGCSAWCMEERVDWDYRKL